VVRHRFGQSLPNLNLSQSHTLLVPGTTTSNSDILLLSPSHRGIDYPPPKFFDSIPGLTNCGKRQLIQKGLSKQRGKTV